MNEENEQGYDKDDKNKAEVPDGGGDRLLLNEEEPLDANTNRRNSLSNNDKTSTTSDFYTQTSPELYQNYLDTLSQSPRDYPNRETYMRALQEWVDEARLWQTLSASYQFYVMANTILPAVNNVETQTLNVENTDQNRTYAPDHISLNPNEGFEFAIPPLWKRFVAEVIDFIIMFIIKLVCIFGYMELFGESNWRDFLEIQKNIVSRTGDLSPMNTELTHAIMILEATYRIGVFLYETTWLYKARMRFGSSTPGKSLMGLTVVIATKMNNVPNENQLKVLIYPAANLGLWNAFGRSFVKNVVLTIMFPFCFTMFLFQHNRTMYDLLFNTVVVEYDPNPPKRNWP